jgi:hypothetical protein
MSHLETLIVEYLDWQGYPEPCPMTHEPEGIAVNPT